MPYEGVLREALGRRTRWEFECLWVFPDDNPQ